MYMRERESPMKSRIKKESIDIDIDRRPGNGRRGLSVIYVVSKSHGKRVHRVIKPWSSCITLVQGDGNTRCKVAWSTVLDEGKKERKRSKKEELRPLIIPPF